MFSANPFKAPPRASDTLLNLLQDAIKIMMFQASDQRVQVDFSAPPEFGKIVTEADLYYVFINIIKNALQAMPQGGRLEVNGFLHDRQMEISFQDTGAGLTSEEMDQDLSAVLFHQRGGPGTGLGSAHLPKNPGALRWPSGGGKPARAGYQGAGASPLC